MVRERVASQITGDAFSIDDLDGRILVLMVSGNSNQEISQKLRKPLSTVQRRTRQLHQSGIIEATYDINYKKFGYKTGLLHIYLSNGEAHAIAEKIGELGNILGVSIHIGNSDVVAEYACKNTEILLELLAKIKSIPGVIRIVWSEEVYTLPHLKKIVEIPAKR